MEREKLYTLDKIVFRPAGFDIEALGNSIVDASKATRTDYDENGVRTFTFGSYVGKETYVDRADRTDRSLTIEDEKGFVVLEIRTHDGNFKSFKRATHVLSREGKLLTLERTIVSNPIYSTCSGWLAYTDSLVQEGEESFVIDSQRVLYFQDFDLNGIPFNVENRHGRPNRMEANDDNFLYFSFINPND